LQQLAKAKLTKLVVLFALPVAAFATTPRWDLNDVSILLPLPKSDSEYRESLHSTTVSDRNREKIENLLPTGIHEDLVMTMDEADRENLRSLYPKWMAVSFRIDPCFHEHFSDGCQKQIRVVWQPIDFSSGKPSSIDAALHTFYPLNETEWPKALSDFGDLKSASTLNLPLGVHPGFKSEGLNGQFAKKFIAKIKPWIEQSRMSVLAVALPSVSENKTVFKRFHVYKNAARRLAVLWISYSPEIEIRYGNSSARGESTSEFQEVLPARLMPVSGVDDLRVLLRNSKKLKENRSDLLKFAEIQRRIVDPTKHASLSVDCLSCHASGMVGNWLSANLSSTEKTQILEPGFKNSGNYNLKNTSVRPGSLNRFRAFGYFGNEVQILDRVIHESALVAEQLNAKP
jgi:hypothetical protein